MMRPDLVRIGERQSPVVTVDAFTEAVDSVVDMAAAMAPFPQAGNYYPGVRRLISRQDRANTYVEQLLEAAAPFIGGAFDADRFTLIEASFSMVTAAPSTLEPAQRAPHFDSTDPDYIALIHYLSETPGTAFFRQAATGIELVDEDNVDRFVGEAKRAAPRMAGYVRGSTADYQEIGRIEGRRDRLALYRGAMLHSGIIPPDTPLSADTRVGRLTTNIFLQCHR